MNRAAPLPWLRYAGMSSPRGARWAEEYAELLPIQKTCQDAVDVLRRRGLDEGGELLRRAHDDLSARGACTPSVRAVADRWYFGAVAFCHYARREYDEAEHYMDRAHEVVVDALEEPFLLPLAMDCYEFEMHRARIARERPHWPALRRHAGTAAAMRDGSLPLCTLRNGTVVGLGDVQAFFRALPGLTDDDRQLLRVILDDDLSRLQGERSVRTVLRLPGFVIQYP
jgi:hypothetical protein